VLRTNATSASEFGEVSKYSSSGRMQSESIFSPEHAPVRGRQEGRRQKERRISFLFPSVANLLDGHDIFGICISLCDVS
jgi:hypothetical protein